MLAERIAAAEAEIILRKKMEEQLTKAGRELRDAKGNTRSAPSSIGQDGDTEEVRELRKYNDDLSVRILVGDSYSY